MPMGADWCRMMARYNRWQNANLLGAADGLDDAARRADRGAFFGSIHRTLSHLLWGDCTWMSRLDGWEAPGTGLAGSADWIGDWEELCRRRREADDRIVDWADRLGEDATDGEVRWYSGVLKAEVSRPRMLVLAHVFNHQTHHRGQVHAMLTAAGARPGDTDLFIMPETA